MTTLTFDTLKFANRLKSAGVPAPQAEAEAEALADAFSEAMDAQLASKNDIHRIERELVILRWMTGIIMGGIIALIMKAFFPT